MTSPRPATVLISPSAPRFSVQTQSPRGGMLIKSSASPAGASHQYSYMSPTAGASKTAAQLRPESAGAHWNMASPAGASPRHLVRSEAFVSSMAAAPSGMLSSGLRSSPASPAGAAFGTGLFH